MKNMLINILLMAISTLMTLVGIEIYMRNSSWYMNGAPHAPRKFPSSITKPADLQRIIVLGDSFTYGDGVYENETFPHQLQEKLISRLGKNYEVLNFGIMGVNLDQLSAILLNGGAYFTNGVTGFHPNLVILTFYTNDIELMPEKRPKDINFLPQTAHKFLNKFILYKFITIKINRLLEGLKFKKSYTDYLMEMYHNKSAEWQQSERLLNMMIDYLKKNNIETLLVIFPSMGVNESHPLIELYDGISMIGKTQNIKVLNLVPYFSGQNPDSLTVSFFNGHPNKRAYDIASEAILKALINERLIK